MQYSSVRNPIVCLLIILNTIIICKSLCTLLLCCISGYGTAGYKIEEGVIVGSSRVNTPNTFPVRNRLSAGANRVLLQLVAEDTGDLPESELLEKVVSRVVVDSRFEITGLYTLFAESVESRTDQQRTSPLFPEFGQYSQIVDNPIGSGSVISGAEDDESGQSSLLVRFVEPYRSLGIGVLPL